MHVLLLKSDKTSLAKNVFLMCRAYVIYGLRLSCLRGAIAEFAGGARSTSAGSTAHRTCRWAVASGGCLPVEVVDRGIRRC